jgi:hypothetical protein
LRENVSSVVGSQFPTPGISSSLFARSNPSDFWLCEYLTRVLQGGSFDEPDELLSGIQDPLREPDHETLDAVFQEWTIRLETIFIEMVNLLSDVETEMFNSLF